MPHARKMLIRFGCYIAGGAALASAGPLLWDTAPAIAAIASALTTLCFIVADAILDTRRLAHRALQIAARHSAEMAAPGAVASMHDAGQDGGQPQAPVETRAATPDPVEAAASNLLQFAAHVSARCGRTAAETWPVSQPASHTHDIAEAVADAQTELHLQPIVGLSDRRTVHYEALTRLRSRTGAVMMPSDFLPVAAAAGTAPDIDTRQLSSIASLCGRIGDRHSETRLFCNLAAPSLRSAAFRAELIAFLQEHKSLSQRIVFEIDAETATALDAGAVADIRTVETMGFAISVDRATLADLPRLQGVFRRLAFLKIDADTIADADPNVLRRLARGGTQIVATHIETEQQAAAARRIGIEFGQGFLFGKPRPARMGHAGQRRAA